MIVDIWLESWRQELNGSNEDNERVQFSLRLHEWLVPFPGFFHAEKQALCSLCKEMLDGIALNELAKCVGLSAAQVENILKHGHAGNNRALLFSLTCAMVINVTNKVLEEDPDLEKTVQVCLERYMDHRDVTEDSGDPDEGHNQTSSRREYVKREKPTRRGLFSKTNDSISHEVLDIGSTVRKAVRNQLCEGPNGKHFVGTVLFGALLPTIGFQVLSRTGHTDVTDAFWFRLTYILHGSNHLKYQELSLYYSFLRAIMPSPVIFDLFENLPGSAVLKLPSFTGRNRNFLDTRDWTYVHLDELLEMLIVRHLKSLNMNFLNHLENAAAWLLQVSQFRALSRRVTGASRAYGRFRGAGDAGESMGPLRFYDRNVPQSRTVGAMLSLMRSCGVLNLQYRGAEWLTNVFSDPPKRMGRKKDQDLLLDIQEYGKKTTALHASVRFPEVFGKLTRQDRADYFDRKKFKRWTAKRRVPTVAQSIRKDGGAIFLSGMTGETAQVSLAQRRPKDNASVIKLLSDRRREISKAKDALYLAGRHAEACGDTDGRQEAASRWDAIHSSRYLV